MTKSKYLDGINDLLADSGFARYEHSLYMNVAATALILGVNAQQVSKIMQGYPKTKVGKDTRYLKSDVYEAMRNIETLMA
jgi:hypothetical protein